MKKFISLCFLFTACFSLSLSAAEYDRILRDMNSIANSYPQFVQMINIGKNDQDQIIYGLRLEKSSVAVEMGKPNYLIVGVHHGNERNTADLCLTFTRKLLTTYESPEGPEAESLAKGIFYIVPVLNISGFNANQRTERARNGRYYDPNRDYQDPCVHNSYAQLASTQNLANFLAQYGVVGSVTVHGYIGTFTYPWGIYTDNTKTLDDGTYRYLASQSVQANGYRIGTHTDVIYAASGSYEDWAYHKYGIWTMLLEISSSANLNNDAACLVKYFALVPTDRSTQHQHTGNCTTTRGEFEGRP